MSHATIGTSSRNILHQSRLQLNWARSKAFHWWAVSQKKIAISERCAVDSIKLNRFAIISQLDIESIALINVDSLVHRRASLSINVANFPECRSDAISISY
jgi:hypothetical protein